MLRMGSSPLTRGKLEVLVAPFGNKGLIPAHAGKTWISGFSRPRAWAHPRSRGENDERYIPLIHERGSSPLTRGKRPRRPRDVRGRRLIPAHAGKTRWPHPRGQGHRAHPRSRGENRCEECGVCDAAGSSPLTRGKRFVMAPCDIPRGLIPAHAGKTRNSRGRQGSCWAHPRSRGENGHGRGEPVNQAGSSPLTRGKPRS